VERDFDPRFREAAVVLFFAAEFVPLDLLDEAAEPLRDELLLLLAERLREEAALLRDPELLARLERLLDPDTRALRFPMLGLRFFPLRDDDDFDRELLLRDPDELPLRRSDPALEAARDVLRCPLLRSGWRRLARLSPSSRACAVSRPISLLKLLCSPPAVSSCTSSASLLSSNFSNQSFHSMGSSDCAPL
jgi:hypothetical protein